MKLTDFDSYMDQKWNDGACVACVNGNHVYIFVMSYS